MKVERISGPLSGRAAKKKKGSAGGGVVVVLVVLGMMAVAATAAFLFWNGLPSSSLSSPSPPDNNGNNKASDHSAARRMDAMGNRIGEKRAAEDEDSGPTTKKNEGGVRGRAGGVAAAAAAAAATVDDNTVFVLSTSMGDIRIVARADLSPESVEYMRRMAAKAECPRCHFYRAEKPGILQGIVKHPDVTVVSKRGDCPPEYRNADQGKCPEWDPNCACHGPTMTRGMVGWAGGGTGPDFFIDTYKEPANFWAQQHTVWGEIRDDASFGIIDRIYDLPAADHGDQMMILDQKIAFTVKIL